MGGTHNMHGENQKFILSFGLKAEMSDNLNVALQYI